ncbi:MFS transporter, partial [Sphingomonas sp. AOB5]|uniref:MFS transporter n=1 Tax=Sphingomonas sp. AOB5 TaxID=3034017 RepID=UPI0023F89779
QLIAGPVSDAIGRRPVLLAGTAIFVTGSIAAALAPGPEILLVARFVEACGAAAAVVAARTIVSDLSPRADAAANLPLLTSAILLSPTLAPTIGGALVSLAGWRFVFVALALTGGVIAALSLFLIPRHAPHAERPRLQHAYARLARNGRFRGYVAGNSLASSALYIFLGGSPFLLIGQWHLSPAQAGLCYLVVAACGILGTFMVRSLNRRHDAFRIGLIAIASGGGLMLVIALLGASNPIALIGPMLLVGTGGGIAAPTGIAGAMHAEDGIAGTASSLAGAIQMITTAAVTALMSAFAAPTLASLAAGISVAGLAAVLFAPAREPA